MNTFSMKLPFEDCVTIFQNFSVYLQYFVIGCNTICNNFSIHFYRSRWHGADWPAEYRELFHPGYQLPIKQLLKFDIDLDVEIKEFPISEKAQTFLDHCLDIVKQNIDIQATLGKNSELLELLTYAFFSFRESFLVKKWPVYQVLNSKIKSRNKVIEY